MRESSFYLFLCFLKIFSCMPQKLTKILSSHHHHHHKTNTNSIVIMRAVNAPYTFSKPSTSNTPSQRRASSSLATTSALPPGFVAFGGLSVFLVGATKASQMRLEQRVGEEMEKCTKNGIDTSDLYYDFDLPGDAYPFGDAEGMDWVPDDWKPPKKGDPEIPPHSNARSINYAKSIIRRDHQGAGTRRGCERRVNTFRRRGWERVRSEV